MRRHLLSLATAVLLLGPTVLAFFAGGYFDLPRAVAGAVAWGVVLLLAAGGPLPFPKSVAGRVALAGLAGLALWSAISLAWAPLGGVAGDNVQRLLLYIAAFLAAIALLRDRRAAGAVEPAFALGAVVVVGYGLAGRLLPGLIELDRSEKANGRLEQPITYWNAEGLVAAMGLVLCARIAGDPSRPLAMRVAAAGACVPLGAGVYLSDSRAAMAAAVAGLIVLLAAAPVRPQLRAAVVSLLGGAVAAACAAAFPAVASLDGSHGTQVRQGAVLLVVLLAIACAAGLVTRRLVGSERRGELASGSFPHHWLQPVAITAALVCLAGLVAGGIAEKPDRSGSAGERLSRLTEVTSHRNEYWRVALRAFERDPLLGTGSGGYRVVWRQERPVGESTLEVHSLVLEVAAELGLPGLLCLFVFLGGTLAAGRQALRRRVPLAPGACAAGTVWLLSATIDWHWQLPAVTLPAIVLGAALVAQTEQWRELPAEDGGAPLPETEQREPAGRPVPVS